MIDRPSCIKNKELHVMLGTDILKSSNEDSTFQTRTVSFEHVANKSEHLLRKR